MYLVRIGYRTVNLEYLIEAADSDLGAPRTEAPDGGLRVSVYPGKMFDVGGEDAARLRLHLQDNLKPLPRDGGERPGRQRASRSKSGRETPDPDSPSHDSVPNVE